jgi:hypothetical protein
MKLLFATLFLFLGGCVGHEGDKIETDNIKNNQLLVPPCLER